MIINFQLVAAAAMYKQRHLMNRNEMLMPRSTAATNVSGVLVNKTITRSENMRMVMRQK